MDEKPKSLGERAMDACFKVCIVCAIAMYTPKIVEAVQSIAESLKAIAKNLGANGGE